MHVRANPKVLYFGTPVVLVSTLNPDGTTNLAPMSSAWWLGRSCVLGLDTLSRTPENLARHGECVLNLADVTMVDAVDRLAGLTGTPDVRGHKLDKGFRYVADKFAAAELTPAPSIAVAPSGVAESSIRLEGRTRAIHPLRTPGVGAVAVEVEVVEVVADERILVPNRPDHISPLAWQPLIMKFAEFFGAGENLRPSTLAHVFGLTNELVEPTPD